MSTCVALSAFLALPSLLPGDDPAVQLERLIGEGDPLPGFGFVRFLYDFRATDDGDWFVRASVEAPDGEQLWMLLENGAPVWIEHDPVPQPAGATVQSGNAWDVGSDGSVATVFKLNGTADSFDDHILLAGDTVLAQESLPVGYAGATPGSTWEELNRVRRNGSNQVVVTTEVDDPTATSQWTDTMVRFDLAPDGTLLSENLLLRRGSTVVGAAETISWISELEFRLNDMGDVLVGVALDSINEINDTVLLNDVVLAREGDPSPVPGATWSGVPTMLDLNERGDTAFYWGLFSGTFPTNSALVRNLQIFVAPGDVLAATAPFGIDRVTAADLNNRGDLVWQGKWDPSSSLSWHGEALFLNTKPLVVEDVTSFGGKLLEDLTGAVTSDDGRYVIFMAETQFQVDSLFRIDLGPWSELDLGELAGSGDAPSLTGIGSLIAGKPITLRVEGGTPGTDAVLVLGLSQVNLPALGTTLVPFPTVIADGLTLDADGAAELQLTWPAGLASGAKIYAQAFVPDAGAPFGFAASDGIEGQLP
ncbi:MAG: hypothetical protein AAF682_13285 [Planctomycetota bacterium]